jgi:hypothetical protein
MRSCMFAFGIHHALHLETVIPAVKSLLDDVELWSIVPAENGNKKGTDEWLSELLWMGVAC